MNRLRNRLILVFVVATLAPLALVGWISLRLLHYSLALSATPQLDQVSQSLESTGRELFRVSAEALKQDAHAGRVPPQVFAAVDKSAWPAAIQDFAATADPETVILDGDRQDRIAYLVRRADGSIAQYSTALHGIALRDLQNQYSLARAVVDADSTHNWQRGFAYTYLLLAAAIWLLTFFALLYFARRISRPIQELTKGLSEVAAGRLDYRVDGHAAATRDEIGSAVRAFNKMAEELKESQDRLVYVTRLESWQALARKMAHEVKSSLTPIRLTMEEIAARQAGSGSGEFYEQAAQIVVDEVQGLERRVRAFSEFSAEPPVTPRSLDINSLLEERIAFLRTAHPGIVYSTRLAPEHPHAFADEDLVKGVLTNLLENAAQAVQPGGVVLGVTASAMSGKIAIEVHDSGPGLSSQAHSTLFQPAISFKRGGMGLGLSIARKSAMLAGGDILLVPGELGGAAFRVLLPVA